jgi:uncharacterized protein
MTRTLPSTLAVLAIASTASSASANTPTWFNPLTQSAPVTAAGSNEELNAPWVTPAGVSQYNLTSMQEVEGDPAQSTVRAPRAGTSASMWDMLSYDATGRFVFIPHETPWGAGLSRYDRSTDETRLLFAGNNAGEKNDWANDYAAFDPSTFTPMCTVLVAEEWSGEGRVMEVLNPYATPGTTPILVRELSSIANVAHEGLRFSRDAKTLYFIDEWNSGSLYKFVMTTAGDLSKGQTFVLKVDAYTGDAAADWNQQPAGTVRTGMATWLPITDANGVRLTTVDPYRNGPTDDPRTVPTTRGGRPAADEVGGTPYGRPEDIELSVLANGNEVMYVATTSENAVYSVEFLANNKAMVRLYASQTGTPKNLGFAPTTGALNAPDNLAQDAAGNIYVIEDAPNGSSTGGDIWFARDVDNNGVAESLDHFLSVRVAGSEATGMIFDPMDPMSFSVAVQHPNTTDLTANPNGFGDSLWAFNIAGTVPVCGAGAPRNCVSRPNQAVGEIRRLGNEARQRDAAFRQKCSQLMRQQMNAN